MQKQKVGRPSKRTGFVVGKIMELARQGKTHNQISEIIGINPSTLSDWKLEDWEFAISLRHNLDLADQVVECSTFKNATGFYFEEEEATKDGVVTVRKFRPPQPGSQIFWLKNRKPDVWRDNPHFKQEEEMEARRKELLALPKDELIKRAELMLTQMKQAKKEDDAK